MTTVSTSDPTNPIIGRVELSDQDQGPASAADLPFLLGREFVEPADETHSRLLLASRGPVESPPLVQHLVEVIGALDTGAQVEAMLVFLQTLPLEIRTLPMEKLREKIRTATFKNSDPQF